jgi:hypothetical protein
MGASTTTLWAFTTAMFVASPRKVDTTLPRFGAGHEHGKQTKEFAAHEHLGAAAPHNQYTPYRGSFTFSTDEKGWAPRLGNQK